MQEKLFKLVVRNAMENVHHQIQKKYIHAKVQKLQVFTVVSGCYDTPQILISDFINFRENQE